MSGPTLTALQARRINLRSLGLGRTRPAAVTARHLNALVDRLGLFQIDSVNVVCRAHLMPAFSRLGAYDEALLHRAYGRAPRRLFEYWAHEASLVDVRLQPALRFRMDSAAGVWGGPRRVADEHPDLIDDVLRFLGDHGASTARELSTGLGHDDAERPRDHWGWNWSLVKQALEWLFYTGAVTSARRTAQFERVYDLPSRVLPPTVLAAPDPTPVEANRILVERAARALGVATEPCLRDYFRLSPAESQAAVAGLVADGVLDPVTIRGWDRPAYRHAEAPTPRPVGGRALLSPFDPLVFERTRLERLFGFRYRIEIYVPAEKRVHGYYVLPFLLRDDLVARVDLKADRAAGTLRVRAAHAEPGAPPDTAAELARELETMAGWLGLGSVTPEPVGGLAAALAASL